MLSVALCTYNGEKFLDQQLDSILHQTTPINEIIICDDGSTDATIKIIQAFQTKYPSTIKLHINEVSLGAIKNFEKAIGLCSGEIIFLSDQDDVWIENKVKRIIEKFETNPSLEAIFSDANLIDDKGNLLSKTLFNEYTFDDKLQEDWSKGRALLDLVYYRNKITGATLAIKKNIFLRAFPFSKIDKLWHDAYLGLHAAANNSLGWINEPLIQYRIHSNQQVGIGNGITINNNESTIKSRKFLTDLKQYFLNCLLIANDLSKKYPDLKKELIEKEAIGWITYLDLRLQLPRNIFSRIYTIANHLTIYKKHSKFLFKSIIKDIISPC